MPDLRHVAAAAALLFALSLTAPAAEEGFLSKLNPFGSSKPTSSAQNKPFPGFSNHGSRRKPEKSMLGKAADSVSNTTRTAWNKTTNVLSPKNLIPGSSSKKAAPAKKKKTASSWSPFSRSEDSPKEATTVNEWLNLDRP